jgi:hypothetical protein
MVSGMANPNDQYSDEEAERRTNEALRRALNTPPKPLATIPRRRPPKAKATPQSPKRGDGDA